VWPHRDSTFLVSFQVVASFIGSLSLGWMWVSKSAGEARDLPRFVGRADFRQSRVRGRKCFRIRYIAKG
jgi:hypothetical protein